MAGTTFKAIREQIEKTVRGLTPKSRKDVPFELWNDQRDMVETASSYPGMVRNFNVPHTFGMDVPEVSDLHTVEVLDSFSVQVVYPLQMFSKNMQELEAIIAEDIHQIDDAIGIHGLANYVTHQHVARLVNPQVSRDENVALLIMSYEVEYTRQVN